MKNIFDMSDVSDLPDDLRPKLTGPAPGRGKWALLMAEAPGDFSAAELRAAMYRKIGDAPRDAAVRRAIDEAVLRGRAERVSPGRYRYIGPRDQAAE